MDIFNIILLPVVVFRKITAVLFNLKGSLRTIFKATLAVNTFFSSNLYLFFFIAF